MKIYRAPDIERLLAHHEKYVLPNDVLATIQAICNEIVPILVEKPVYKKELKKKEFKPTVLEAKENPDQWMSDVRICLNKLSVKNYDNQKDKIIELLKKPDQYSGLVKMIFDIASSNMFYAEIYARLYKELIDLNPEFREILTDYLTPFANSVKELKYVDPEKNYEEHCIYNKQNDGRKATVVFVVHLMKLGIIPTLKVLSIIESFQEIANVYSDEDDRTNEIDEISEIIHIFIKEGISIFSVCKAEWIWKFVILKNIQDFAKFKKGDRKSVTSRTVFKYMDIMQLIQKHQADT